MKRSAFIGLVAAAALALTATGGAASASASTFNGSYYPLLTKTITTTTMAWSFGAYKFKCTTVQGRSKLASSSPKLVQTMDFYGCVLGGLEAQINMNGCTFDDSITSAAGGTGTGGREIACSAGNQITITRGACVLQIPPQVIPGTVSYANGKSGMTEIVNATFSLSGIKYTGGIGCAAEHIGARENGGMSGGWRIQGYASVNGAEAGQINFWVQ